MVPRVAWEFRSHRSGDGHGFAACPRNRTMPTALIFYSHSLQPPRPVSLARLAYASDPLLIEAHDQVGSDLCLIFEHKMA